MRCSCTTTGSIASGIRWPMSGSAGTNVRRGCSTGCARSWPPLEFSSFSIRLVPSRSILALAATYETTRATECQTYGTQGKWRGGRQRTCARLPVALRRVWANWRGLSICNRDRSSNCGSKAPVDGILPSLVALAFGDASALGLAYLYDCGLAPPIFANAAC